MPITTYNDGSKYGDADAIYGRISTDLVVAQNSQARETGLKVTVIDDRSNAWEYFIGTDLNARELFISTNKNPPADNQGYWSYRLGASMIKLSGGKIIRIRNGDGSLGDRQVYVQEITDPTVASQWTSWSLLYSGNHYGIALQEATSTTYDVFSAKSDGLYKNNSKKWDKTGLIAIYPVVGQKDALFVLRVSTDPIEGPPYRDLDLFYTDNIEVTAPTADPVNYRWYRNSISAMKLSDGRVARVQAMGLYQSPRVRNNGDSITVAFNKDVSTNIPSEPRLIRGLAGQVGHNTITWPKLFQLSDGFYYLFYSETHADNDYDAISNFLTSPAWQRSKNLLHWSEPVPAPIGGGWGFAGVVEASGYVWFAGNGSVYRRPSTSVSYDISNYVPQLQFDIPRDNQPGNGSFPVANLAGINDTILGLTDRKVKIEVGIKTATGLFEFAQFNDWWVRNVSRQIDGEAQRLQLEFGDLWFRLENLLRDTYNFVGKLDWQDWAEGKRNKKFNYYGAGSAIETADFRLKTSGLILYTGWKGHNPLTEIQFNATISGDTPALVYRYKDSKNYYKAELDGTNLNLIRKRDDVDSTLATVAVTADSTPNIRVEVIWAIHKIYLNGVLKITHTETVPGADPGYVGFRGTKAYTISNFLLTDWETAYTTEDLIRVALAMGDYHDAKVAGGGDRQLAIIWGPQTDIPSAADGLRFSLESAKLQMIWRDGFIEVGKFTDKSIVKTIQDRIISTEHSESADRRINVAVIDGNEHSWIELDDADLILRSRALNGYFDLPELLDQSAVTARAQEEIRRGKLGSAPGGSVVLFLDLWRMDAVTWIDNIGNSKDVRIEGMVVDVNQSSEPHQRMNIDTSLLA